MSPFNIGARLHRLIYKGIYRSDRLDSMALMRINQATLTRLGAGSSEGQDNLFERIAKDAADRLSLNRDQQIEAKRFVVKLFQFEDIFYLPELSFFDHRSVSEYWEMREQLAAQRNIFDNFEKFIEATTNLVVECYGAVQISLVNYVRDQEQGPGIQFATKRIDKISGLAAVVEQMVKSPFAEELDRLNCFNRLRRNLEINLIAASGGNPDAPNSFSKPFRYPTKYDSKSSDELVKTYVGGTPLLELFDGSEEFVIPQSLRFEHHHIVAGTGHGKTQTLQYLIDQDLKLVADGKRSVVVIDSQGDLIKKISSLSEFAPGGPLHEKIVIIDPEDVEYPVALNMFDIGQNRLDGYGPLERERLMNSILELYDFVLASLLAAGMTQKQDVLFKFVIRLMMQIPDATIYTLRSIFESDDISEFQEYVDMLDGTAKHFFDKEFAGSEFKQTKSQVRRRLLGVLENRTFERMFAHPRSKLDLYSEMNSGKVILINTAKSLLKQSNSETFGRFFIALIAQAAQERAVLKESKRMPTIVYIDEAADYFDHNIELILTQARKYKVGMVLAHQFMNQLSPNLAKAFSSNTSIKFAGGVSFEDSRSMAGMLQCEPDFIQKQNKLSFAAFAKGITKTAISLEVPYGVLEKKPKMNLNERTILKAKMREKFANHFSNVHTTPENNQYPSDSTNPKPDHKTNDQDKPETDASSEW